MSLHNEMAALRGEVASLAKAVDKKMLMRHALPPSSPGKRVLIMLGNFLKALGLSDGIVARYPWPVLLKHGRALEEGRTLLVWAVGEQQDRIRSACDGFSKLLDDDCRYVPVLVTDVADFAYYSRLGWMVEYLPKFGGENSAFFEQKRRYLAYRYKGATVVPIAAGLLSHDEWRSLV